MRLLSAVPSRSDLVLGIGDDCAIYRPRGSREDLLFTSDLFIEDVHFRKQTHRARDVGHVAVTRSLSDIAAMGGTPRFALLAFCVPEWASELWVKRFFDSAVATLAGAGAVLAGGDLSRAGKLCCDVTLCGAVPVGKALRRDGARPGDRIYVSGALGGSALGLESRRGKAWKRHLQPEARLALGVFLRGMGATAAVDISDGLSLDLERLCLASGVGAEIRTPPVFPGASLKHALHGGEEYELLFTAGPKTRVPAAFEGLTLTSIGTISNGPPGEVMVEGKRLEASGYDHFRT